MNTGVGDEGEPEFASVDDAFLAGLEAWGELGQMQGPLLGTGPGQGSSGGVSGGANGTGSNTGINGPVGGGGGAGGMTYRSGLGGSMQSFLGEAGMYGDNANSPGGDSFKDGFDGSGKDFTGKEFGAVGGGGDGTNTSNAGSNPNRRSGSQQQGLETCKLEPREEGDDDNDLNDSDEEHEYGAQHDDLDTGGAGDDAHGSRDGSELRGLGRIFGMGTHPVVAEAQARAEALVHGRGGKGGPNSAVDAAEKKRKRAVLSKEERAKQNRDRNREHARNTRLRKKAFVEELKKQVEDLVAGREREERERRAETRRDSSLRDMRLQVLLTFLEYRGRGETSRQAWQSVLDDQFEMRMPLTPYRTFPPHQVQGGIRVIKGVEGVLLDTASLAVATRGSTIAAGRPNRQEAKCGSPLQAGQGSKGKGRGNGSSDTGAVGSGRIKRELSTGSTGIRSISSRSQGSTAPESCSGSDGGASRAAAGGSVAGKGAVRAAMAAAAPTRVYYVVDPKEVMVNKNAFMCPFVARSSQILVPGMLRCTFSTKSNRLSSLHMSFDPTVPTKQLARANLAGRSSREMPSFMLGGPIGDPQQAIPEDGARTRVSSSSVSGGSSSPVVSPKTAQGSEQSFAGQDGGVLHSVLEDIREWRVSSTLVDDPHEGKSYLRVYPLNGDTPGVTHFIGVLESLAASQNAGAAGGNPSGVEAMMETVVNNVTNNASSGVVPGQGEACTAPKGTVGEESSSQREAGTSEGETSSDSTGSRGRHASSTGPCSAGGVSSSGSGGSDDGSGTGSRGRSSRSFSGATTAASDGSASGYEMRRSTRRTAASPPTPTPEAGTFGSPTVGSPAVAGSISRSRSRSDASKRSRA